MAQVKFVTVVKYKDKRYPAHTPFEVCDKDVESLVKDGAIVTVPPEAAQNPDDSEKSIDQMKVEELKAYAAEHNIDISGVERKADIVAAIKAAENSEE